MTQNRMVPMARLELRIPHWFKEALFELAEKKDDTTIAQLIVDAVTEKYPQLREGNRLFISRLTDITRP